MYLRTVQLGIQELAGHPWLLHACAICAAIRFLRMGFDAFSCCTAVLSLASARKKLPSINKCRWKIPAVFAKQVPGVVLQPSCTDFNSWRQRIRP